MVGNKFSPSWEPLLEREIPQDNVGHTTQMASTKAPNGVMVASSVYVVPKAPKDDVYHPTHYSRWKMEPVEFIAINDLPWWLANVIKYTMRFDAKDGLQDLYKARSYLDMKIRQLEGHDRFWDKPVEEERKLNVGSGMDRR